MAFELIQPDLEKCFLPPSNWQIKSFINPETNHRISYRTAFIDNAEATLIILPGLSEFSEKYIETTHFFNKQSYNVVVIDWAYQGLSIRHSKNKHKRHSDGYDSDISDLHYLITQKIKNNLPHYMLAHSMGGHIGLRYLAENPNSFKAASFSAPMLGIEGLKHGHSLYLFLLKYFTRIENAYVPGGHNWKKEDRHNFINSIFSSDKTRNQVHNAWCLSNPSLQIGSPTFKWIKESLLSISLLKEPNVLNRIKTLVLLAIAEKEKIVQNKEIKNASEHIPDNKLLVLDQSQHEILMETDSIRDKFLEETLKLFNQ